MLASVESVFIHSQVPVSKFPRATPSSDIAVQDKPVKEVVAEIVSSKLSQTGDADQENSFYVCDIGDIFRQYLRWKSLLPRIEPFFGTIMFNFSFLLFFYIYVYYFVAFKSNPDPMVLKLLAAVGIGFDCASKNEIQTILDLGVDPTRIIYAHTCKQASFIRYAAQKNVAKMTFDNAEELQKIKKYYPNAELLLRILTDDSKAVAQLGLKFGAPLDTVPHLLETAKQLDLNVVGVR
jgi:ornithine decarboxylase